VDKHQWKATLGLFLASTEASKLPAGSVYELLGLPRAKQKRSAQDALVVKVFMEELGWYYRENGTRPYFAKRKAFPLIVIKPWTTTPVEATLP
jgi:hypothetical protein